MLTLSITVMRATVALGRRASLISMIHHLHDKQNFYGWKAGVWRKQHCKV